MTVTLQRVTLALALLALLACDATGGTLPLPPLSTVEADYVRVLPVLDCVVPNDVMDPLRWRERNFTRAPIVLETPVYDGGVFVASVVAAVLKHVMGYQVEVRQYLGYAGSCAFRLAYGVTDVALAQYVQLSTAVYSAALTDGVMLAPKAIDATYQTGIFLSAATVTANPSLNLDHWRSLSDPHVIANLIPRTGTVAGVAALCPASMGCVLSAGRFIPAQCASPGAICGEVLKSSVFEDGRFTERLIQGLNLNLTVAYVSKDTLVAAARAAVAAGQPVLFVDTTPLVRFATMVGAFARISFPFDASDCINAASLTVPLFSSPVTCEYPSQGMGFAVAPTTDPYVTQLIKNLVFIPQMFAFSSSFSRGLFNINTTTDAAIVATACDLLDELSVAAVIASWLPVPPVRYAPEPVFSPGTGTTSTAELVTVALILASPLSGATIHYTLDGSRPTVNSTVYTAPIELRARGAHRLRAVTLAALWDPSAVTEAIITLNKSPRSLLLTVAIPVLVCGTVVIAVVAALLYYCLVYKRANPGWLVDYAELEFLETIGAGASSTISVCKFRGTRVAAKRFRLQASGDANSSNKTASVAPRSSASVISDQVETQTTSSAASLVMMRAGQTHGSSRVSLSGSERAAATLAIAPATRGPARARVPTREPKQTARRGSRTDSSEALVPRYGRPRGLSSSLSSSSGAPSASEQNESRGSRRESGVGLDSLGRMTGARATPGASRRDSSNGVGLDSLGRLTPARSAPRSPGQSATGSCSASLGRNSLGQDTFGRVLASAMSPKAGAGAGVGRRTSGLGLDSLGRSSGGRTGSPVASIRRSNRVADSYLMTQMRQKKGGSSSANKKLRLLRKMFVNEVALISELRHPHVVLFMGAATSKGEFVILTELLERGSLFDVVHNVTLAMDWRFRTQLLIDATAGLQYLHSLSPPLLHRDVKSLNFLVSADWRVKVCDFGVSSVRSEGAAVVGTIQWLAPEVIMDGAYSTASDMYALGVVLWEVASRLEPYEGQSLDDIIGSVIEGTNDLALGDDVPSELVELVRELTVLNPKTRPAGGEVHSRLTRLQARLPATESPSLNSTGIGERQAELVAAVYGEGVALHSDLAPVAYESVTVLFCDVVGFTAISASLSPVRVANMLRRLYAKFDRIARLRSVSKVETIGDAYMAISGLDRCAPADHAYRVARMALDMVAAAAATPVDERDPRSPSVAIRVGIDSGPVAASVSGSIDVKLTFVGDTVNTASRMEHSAEPSTVVASERTRALIGPALRMRECPVKSMKGKGAMRSFVVLAPKPENDASACEIDWTVDEPASTAVKRPANGRRKPSVTDSTPGYSVAPSSNSRASQSHAVAVSYSGSGEMVAEPPSLVASNIQTSNVANKFGSLLGNLND